MVIVQKALVHAKYIPQLTQRWPLAQWLIVSGFLCFFCTLVQAGNLRLERAWARPNAPVVPTGAVYLLIYNDGTSARQLLKVSSQIATRVELHESFNQDNVMKMRHRADGISIAPSTVARLEPGGLHIMLMGLSQPLSAGQTFQLTLQFDADETLVTDVVVSVEPPQ